MTAGPSGSNVSDKRNGFLLTFQLLAPDTVQVYKRCIAKTFCSFEKYWKKRTDLLDTFLSDLQSSDASYAERKDTLHKLISACEKSRLQVSSRTDKTIRALESKNRTLATFLTHFLVPYFMVLRETWCSAYRSSLQQFLDGLPQEFNPNDSWWHDACISLLKASITFRKEMDQEIGGVLLTLKVPDVVSVSPNDSQKRLYDLFVDGDIEIEMAEVFEKAWIQVAHTVIIGISEVLELLGWSPEIDGWPETISSVRKDTALTIAATWINFLHTVLNERIKMVDNETDKAFASFSGENEDQDPVFWVIVYGNILVTTEDYINDIWKSTYCTTYTYLEESLLLTRKRHDLREVVNSETISVIMRTWEGAMLQIRNIFSDCRRSLEDISMVYQDVARRIPETESSGDEKRSLLSVTPSILISSLYLGKNFTKFVGDSSSKFMERFSWKN